ncbi:MAG TPA: tRNA pseudouridine(13) synthase TruD [Woeseiaceae bacterium]|nr:tRNA pseudouridine(13) synthase TruD [Woeseiaceae bacterium]
MSEDSNGAARTLTGSWLCAHGGGLLDATIRTAPEEFQVDEELGFDASGEGEHDLLKIEKSGVNTEWLARQLAQHARVKSVDVGYAGRKDRHALTTQYFSVRRPGREGTDWSNFTAEGVRVLDILRHNRKLRRGAHSANYFRIAVRAADIDTMQPEVLTRWQRITELGVPNYFGPQRFGRNNSNLGLARDIFKGKRVRRAQRSICLSAARSWLFNEILSRRVAAGNWNRLVRGDLANLDGSGSVFKVDEVSDELEARCARFDIHPSASLWGEGAPLTGSSAADIESVAVSPWPELTAGLIDARIAAGSRAMRLVPTAASLAFAENVAYLEFRLPRGGFATSVLAELVRF